VCILGRKRPLYDTTFFSGLLLRNRSSQFAIFTKFYLLFKACNCSRRLAQEARYGNSMEFDMKVCRLRVRFPSFDRVKDTDKNDYANRFVISLFVGGMFCLHLYRGMGSKVK